MTLGVARCQDAVPLRTPHLKTALCFAVLFLSAVGTSFAAPDDIDLFVKDFSVDRLNGRWPTFDLPPNTSPEKVVAALAGVESKDEQFRGYRILEARKINMPRSELNGYTVVLIASNRGSKTIILLEPPGFSPGFVLHYVGKDRLGWVTPFFYITTVP